MKPVQWGAVLVITAQLTACTPLTSTHTDGMRTQSSQPSIENAHSGDFQQQSARAHTAKPGVGKADGVRVEIVRAGGKAEFSSGQSAHATQGAYSSLQDDKVLASLKSPDLDLTSPGKSSSVQEGGIVYTSGTTHENGSTLYSMAVLGDVVVEPNAKDSWHNIPGALPRPTLVLTPEVQREINYFVERDRRFILSALEERQKYYSQINKVFRQHGIPPELMNIAMIESRFQTNAVSRAGAAGIWQFIKSTAKIYGLETTRRRDERRDPIRSSIAAARHLKHLYEYFNDWFLALAAYNAGLGRITRALTRAKLDDFWDLARSGLIARETAQYVPRFIAVTLIMNNPEKYGFTEIASLTKDTAIG